jgi:regulation of enolase protein 1 (concanavalin A-like superfamily)
LHTDRIPITLWDIGTQRKVASLPAVGNTVAAAFSPDGRLLASTDQSVVKLFELATKREVATLSGHGSDMVSELAFSPDGKLLASAGWDQTVRLWDPIGKRSLGVLNGYASIVYHIAFSRDGKRLAAGCADGTVTLWDLATQQKVATLQGHAQPVGPVVFSPDGNTLASAGADTTIRLWRAPPFAETDAALRRRAILPAAPVAALPGWMGCSMNEGRRIGSAGFDPATGVITLRGSGADVWGPADGGYFLNRAVSGDFQVAVRMLTQSTAVDDLSKAGLMMREALDPGARRAFFCTAPPLGLRFHWRAMVNEDNDQFDVPELISRQALKLPITLRLTRRGAIITTETSRDEGRSFQPAGKPLTFDPPLAKTVYAGLAITSRDEDQIREAKFSGLAIGKP